MYLVKWLKNKKTNNTKPDKYRSKWKSHTLLMGIWYNHFGKPSDNIYENWTCELYDQAFPLLGIYLIYGTKRHTDEHLEEPKLETNQMSTNSRTHLPMQETRIQSLIQEDPTCPGATKPVRHNYWACALEPTSHNHWSRHTLQPALEEKPPQWEARTRQATRQEPHSPQREKSPHSNEDPVQPKRKNFFKKISYCHVTTWTKCTDTMLCNRSQTLRRTYIWLHLCKIHNRQNQSMITSSG